MSRAFNLKIDYKLHRRIVYCSIILSILFSLSMPISIFVVFYLLGFGLTTTAASALMTFNIIYTTLLKGFYIVQFILATWMLQVRFQGLNEYLSGENSLGVRKVSTTKYFPTLKLVMIYHNLCDAIEIVNETFTLHLAAIFLNFMVRNFRY